MLNPFPTMWLSLLAFFVLRVLVGLSLILLGMRHTLKPSTVSNQISWLPRNVVVFYGIVELGIGAALTAGYHTQYACLIGILVFMPLLLVSRRTVGTAIPSRHYYLLLIAAFISLFITGAGAFAFDLPI